MEYFSFDINYNVFSGGLHQILALPSVTTLYHSTQHLSFYKKHIFNNPIFTTQSLQLLKYTTCSCIQLPHLQQPHSYHHPSLQLP